MAEKKKETESAGKMAAKSDKTKKSTTKPKSKATAKAASKNPKAKTKKSILITGACGFLGTHAVRLATKAGYNVTASDLSHVDTSCLSSYKCDLCPGDLTDRKQVRELVKDKDYVIHIAALFNLSAPLESLLKVNLEATTNLAEECAAAGVKHLVLCSTTDSYGTHRHFPIKENDAQIPDNNYSYSKMLGERAVLKVSREKNLPVSIIRPTVIYGPGAVYTASMFCVIPFLIQDLIGFVPRLTGGFLVNAVHVEDVAGALLYVLGKKEAQGEAFNISDDDWLTTGEFFYNMWNSIGVNWRLTLPLPKKILRTVSVSGYALIPDAVLKQFNRLLQARWSVIIMKRNVAPVLNPRFDKGFFSYGMGDHVYSNSKIKSIGYKLKYPHFVNGFHETALWYKEHNWIPHKP